MRSKLIEWLARVLGGQVLEAYELYDLAQTEEDGTARFLVVRLGSQ